MIERVKTFLKGMTHNADGTVSATKVMQIVGFVFVTWWLTYLVYNDQFTEWYLLSYLVFPFGLRGAQAIAAMRLGKRSDNAD